MVDGIGRVRPAGRFNAQENRRTVNLFVGNVPHGTSPSALAKCLEGYLRGYGRWQGPSRRATRILRCQVQRKGVSTFAFVVVGCEEDAQELETGALRLGGRALAIKRSRGTVKNRPVGGNVYWCGGFQLCAEWPPGHMTCVSQVTTRTALQVSQRRRHP